MTPSRLRWIAAGIVVAYATAAAAPAQDAPPDEAARVAYWLDRLQRGPEPTPILLPNFHQGLLLDAQRQLVASPRATLERLADPALRERVQANPVRDAWIALLVVLVPIARERPDVARAWALPAVDDRELLLRRAGVEVLSAVRSPQDAPALLAALRRDSDDRYVTPLALKSLLALGAPWDGEAARVALEAGIGDLPDGTSSTWGGLVPAALESTAGARDDLLAGLALLLESSSPRPPRRTVAGESLPDGTEALGFGHVLSGPGTLPAALARAALARRGYEGPRRSVAADLRSADEALVGIARTAVDPTPQALAAARDAVLRDAALMRAPAAKDPAAVAARARRLRDDPSPEATEALARLLETCPAEPAWREVFLTTSDLLRARGAEPTAWVEAALASFDPARVDAALAVVRRSRAFAYAEPLERFHDAAGSAPLRPAVRRELAFLYGVGAAAGEVPPDRAGAFARRVAAWSADPDDPAGRGLLSVLVELGPPAEEVLVAGLGGRLRPAYVDALGQANGRRVPASVTRALLEGVGDATPSAARRAVWIAVFASASGDDAAVLDATVARLRGPARDEAAMLARIVRHRAPR